MRWLRGRLGDLRLRLLGPGEIQPAPDRLQPLLQCTHRWPDGSSAWGPCRRYGIGPDQWVWNTTCQRCGLVARC
jgi:hypothetical protein